MTPWAARALDRSLAAVVVAIARHLWPELTPEKAVQRLRDIPGHREEVVDVIAARAPDDGVVGGRDALRRCVEGLPNDWEAVVSDLGPRAGDANMGTRLRLRLLPGSPRLATPPAPSRLGTPPPPAAQRLALVGSP